MKFNTLTNTLNLCLLVIATALLFHACSKEQNLNFALIDAKATIDAYNVNKSLDDQAKYFVGDVQFKTESETGAIVYIQNNEITEPFFYLFQSDQKFEELEIKIKNAEVLFFHNHLIINALDKDQRYLIQLDGEVLTDLAYQMKFHKVFNGFGLGKYDGSPIAEEDGAAVARDFLPIGVIVKKPSCICVANGTNPAPACASGGPGSTLCSIGSSGGCTVQCANTHYACCNY